MKRFLPIVLSLITGPLVAQETLSLADAVTMALERNADIVVERESLVIAGAALLRAEAAYEPTLRGDARVRGRTDPVNSILSGAPAGEVAPATVNLQTSASVAKLLPSGATVSVFSALSRDRTDSVLALLNPSWSTLLGAEIRQPLLQNRHIDPARRAIRIARIDHSRAGSSLRRTATEIVAAVDRAYWSVAAARRDLEVRESNVAVAERHREDTRVRIEAGTQAESDLAQTTAEVERRRSEMVSARESLSRAENALRNLIVRDAADPLWERPIVPADSPMSPRPPVDVSSSIARALETRPELLEVARRLDRLDVEIESAADRVRPQVDLVASYIGRGLAGSENEDAISPFGRPVEVAGPIDGSLGRSLGTLAENRFPDASLGLAVTIPIGNTAAKQDVAIARATKRQASATLAQARQRVALEVRNAVIALVSAEQRIEATRASREAAEVQLQAERDRFEAGTTNQFFILTRQNDLATALVAEAVAVTDYRKAQTEFARATGTLLEERGIEVAE